MPYNIYPSLSVSVSVSTICTVKYWHPIVSAFYCIMGYFHEAQTFINAALLALAEIFMIQKFTTLSSRNQHFAKIYGSFVVCVMQLATMYVQS